MAETQQLFYHSFRQAVYYFQSILTSNRCFASDNKTAKSRANNIEIRKINRFELSTNRKYTEYTRYSSIYSNLLVTRLSMPNLESLRLRGLGIDLSSYYEILDNVTCLNSQQLFSFRHVNSLLSYSYFKQTLSRLFYSFLHPSYRHLESFTDCHNQFPFTCLQITP